MTSSTPLGRLEQVDVRQVWQHEAHEFTPWLLDNTDALADALGMDLELNTVEHAVGGFTLDLIGMDAATNEIVIIENQLETTDHSHLGQLLTYAGGTDAVNIVWIAREFREEHRAALDWLNTRTNANTRFFGVQLAVVRIGNSLPAPSFRLVVQPNDWGKTIRAGTQAGTGADSKMRTLYAEFWQQYLDTVHAKNLTTWTRARMTRGDNWFEHPTGTSWVALSTVFGQGGTLRSELVLQHPDYSVNVARFAQLTRYRQQLETAYGAELDFDPPHEKRKSGKIREIGSGSVARREHWSDYIGWFIERQRRLRAAIDAIGGIATLDEDS